MSPIEKNGTGIEASNVHDALCTYIRFFAEHSMTTTCDLKLLARLLPDYQLIDEWKRATAPQDTSRTVSIAYKWSGDSDFTVDAGYFDPSEGRWYLNGGGKPPCPILFWTEAPDTARLHVLEQQDQAERERALEKAA